MTYVRPADSRAKQAENKRILRASDICHICGRPGSDAVDHVMPLARGGADHISNKAPAHHNVAPYCNRRKGDRLPSEIDRKIVLICGPPGAGKTTLAHSLGLAEVMDLDDPKWEDNDSRFRAAMMQLREQPHARAAVIRTGATRSARQKSATLCGATEVVVLSTDLATCVRRIRERNRLTPPIALQIKGARQWWKNYEPGEVKTSFASLRIKRSSSLA